MDEQDFFFRDARRDGSHAQSDGDPDPPAGGSGPGAARPPGALAAGRYGGASAHPQSPAARSANARAFVPKRRTVSNPDIGTGLRVVAPLEELVAAHAARLCGSLPDPFLREHVERHVGLVGRRYRRRLTIGSDAGAAALLIERLHDLVAWIDPSHFARLGDRFTTRHLLAGSGAGGRGDTDFRALVRVVDGVFAMADARWRERSSTAAARGERQAAALVHEWKRRLELLAIGCRGRREGATGKVSNAVTPRQLLPAPPGQTWVAFRLVDSTGKPMAGEPYEVTLPGGSRRSGRLDKNGLARFDDIEPGQCEICFPERDGQDWARA